jgi:hypothetical protein
VATKTIAVEPELSPAELNAEYNRLALIVSQGDKGAERQLIEIEERIQENLRGQRRAEAARAEEQRLATEAERQARVGIRQAEEAAHQSALVCKRAAFDLVEQMTTDLVQAIKAALIAGDEARSTALRLGYSPGILASSQISTYIAWKLGRDGVDTAGLSDLMPVMPAMRVPLIQPIVTD